MAQSPEAKAAKQLAESIGHTDFNVYTFAMAVCHNTSEPVQKKIAEAFAAIAHLSADAYDVGAITPGSRGYLKFYREIHELILAQSLTTPPDVV